MPDLFIEHVDLQRLDQQRLALATIPLDNLTPTQKNALVGVQHMLDSASDKAHHSGEDWSKEASRG